MINYKEINSLGMPLDPEKKSVPSVGLFAVIFFSCLKKGFPLLSLMQNHDAEYYS